MSKLVTARLSDDNFQRLHDICGSEGCNPSQLLNRLVEIYQGNGHVHVAATQTMDKDVETDWNCKRCGKFRFRKTRAQIEAMPAKGNMCSNCHSFEVRQNA